MSIQSVSFWQQDQNYWNQSQSNSQSLAQSDALISAIGTVMTNEGAGLASIANQEALDRTNTQLTSAIQSALQNVTGSSTSSSVNSSGGNSSASSAATNSNAGSSSSSNPTYLPATGTGTVPLTLTTPLSSLLIPPNGIITVNDGSNTTTYASTGTDTVGNLINAINTNSYGNAQVTASLNSSGNLVITGDYNTDTVTVGGTFAPVIGFGSGNNTFQPTVANGSATSGSGTSGSSSSSTASSAGTTANSAASSTGTSTGSSSTSSPSTSSSSAIPNNSSYALQTSGTAELLLASSGLAGTLLNVLA